MVFMIYIFELRYLPKLVFFHFMLLCAYVRFGSVDGVLRVIRIFFFVLVIFGFVIFGAIIEGFVKIFLCFFHAILTSSVSTFSFFAKIS